MSKADEIDLQELRRSQILDLTIAYLLVSLENLKVITVDERITMALIVCGGDFGVYS